MIAALGVTWNLDGLEVTMVGNVASVLTDPESGLSGGMCIADTCLAALYFSYITDRYKRKKLFLITLGIYLLFTAATTFS